MSLLLSIALIILAGILWNVRERQIERHRRESLIRWYTDDSHKSKRVK